MKKLVIAISIGVLMGVSALCTVNKAEQVLSDGIIRMHIRANSNSKEDQELKLKVRDRILDESKHLFADAQTTESAHSVAKDNLELFKNAALDEIQKNGYSYDVRVTLGKSDFPTKTYDDITMPAGTYEALVVEIGSGKGENWWCVMFPPLCFVDEACVNVSSDSEQILIDNLGKDTYSMLKGGKVKIRFKLYELFFGVKERKPQGKTARVTSPLKR